MVKNTTGGTKTKGLARKHVKTANSGGNSIRLPENNLEQIVYVNKMLGNGMCEVYNNDDIRLIAHIRNKFKGRHKRSNNITANSYILIGLREWETPYKNCDVIFVYEDNHIHTIRNLPHLPIHKIINRNYHFAEHDDTLFKDDDTDHEILTNTHQQLHLHDDYDYDYDYDDI